MKWGTVAVVAGLALGAWWLFGRSRAAAGASGGQRQYTPAEKRAALDYLQRVDTDPAFRAVQPAGNLVRAEVVAGTAGVSASVDNNNVGDRIAAAMRV